MFISGVFKESEFEIKDDIDKQLVNNNCCIIYDKNSKNTYENALEVAKWLNLNQKIEKIILVSSYYHLPRSFLIFNNLITDTEIFLIPADYKIVFNENFIFHARIITLEYFKIIYTFFHRNELFRSFIFYIFFYVGTVCFFLTFSPVQLFSYKFVVYLSNLWTRSVIKLSKLILGIDYIISGLENIPKEGSFIVASNHQSAWETFFFGSLFPGSVYILKDELKQIPILRGYFNRLGFIFVERNKTFKSLKTVLRSARRLTKNQKKVFVIFPEGTRLSPGETGKINPGFFAIHKFFKNSNSSNKIEFW